MDSFAHVSKTFEIPDPNSVEKCLPDLMAFLSAKPSDPGLKDITGAPDLSK